MPLGLCCKVPGQHRPGCVGTSGAQAPRYAHRFPRQPPLSPTLLLQYRPLLELPLPHSPATGSGPSPGHLRDLSEPGPNTHLLPPPIPCGLLPNLSPSANSCPGLCPGLIPTPLLPSHPTCHQLHRETMWPPPLPLFSQLVQATKFKPAKSSLSYLPTLPSLTYKIPAIWPQLPTPASASSNPGSCLLQLP